MLNRPTASRPARFVGQVIEGAAKPVGGDTQATIELVSPDEQGGRQAVSSPARRTIWAEARQLADRARTGG